MAAPSLIPPDVETALNSLSPQQRQQVFDFVAFLYQQQNNLQVSPPPKQPRHFGQCRGRISMSEDFDAPLPDSFWLGES
jgi:Protein of unknown function (DUF2281)